MRLPRSSPLLVLALLATPALAQTRFTSIGSGPTRVEHGYAYDSGRDRTVLFAGIQSGTRRDDVWEHDGTSWTSVSAFPRPPARSRPAMAYDPVRQEVLMFGGRAPGGGFYNDTWAWDGSQWTQKSPASSPSQRSGAAMCWDEVRQEIVLFGGFVPAGTDSDETWTWDGSNWTRKFPSSSPLNRGAHRVEFDPVRGVAVLFGGWNSPQSGTLGDTWLWNGSDWKQQTGAGPSNRCDQGMAFDRLRGRMVVFAGLERFLSNGTPVVVDDTWELDASGWSSINPAGTTPSSRAYPVSVWDAPRDRILLHAGMDPNGTLNDGHALETVDPAGLTAFGSGCTGSAGVPSLETVPFSLPWIGDPFDVDITGAPVSSSLAFMVLGFSNTTWNGFPLPFPLDLFGLNGCQAWVGADQYDIVGLSGGSGTWSRTVPPNTALVGLDFYLQAVVMDNAAPRPRGASLTGALHGVVGLR